MQNDIKKDNFKKRPAWKTILIWTLGIIAVLQIINMIVEIFLNVVIGANTFTIIDFFTGVIGIIIIYCIYRYRKGEKYSIDSIDIEKKESRIHKKIKYTGKDMNFFKEYKYIVIAFIIVLILVFFWYEYRPYTIKKMCGKIAIQKVDEITKNNHSCGCMEYDYHYEKCLTENGFHE